MQSFIKSAWSDFQLRTQVSRAISRATDTARFEPVAEDVAAVIALAIQHPVLVVAGLKGRLEQDNPSVQYLSLAVVEDCLNASNSAFHDAFAENQDIQDVILRLALFDGGTPSARKVRSAARKLVLDVSRMFFGSRHEPTAALAAKYEQKCGRKLVRAVLAEGKRVQLIPPRPQDVKLISPRDKYRNMAAAVAAASAGGSLPPILPVPVDVAAAAAAGESPQAGARAAIPTDDDDDRVECPLSPSTSVPKANFADPFGFPSAPPPSATQAVTDVATIPPAADTAAKVEADAPEKTVVTSEPEAHAHAEGDESQPSQSAPALPPSPPADLDCGQSTVSEETSTQRLDHTDDSSESVTSHVEPAKTLDVEPAAAVASQSDIASATEQAAADAKPVAATDDGRDVTTATVTVAPLADSSDPQNDESAEGAAAAEHAASARGGKKKNRKNR